MAEKSIPKPITNGLEFDNEGRTSLAMLHNKKMGLRREGKKERIKDDIVQKIREDRKPFIDRQTFEVEMAEIRGDLRAFYQITKWLAGVLATEKIIQ